MNRAIIVSLLLLACAFAESDVLELDSTNFETVLAENDVILVEFYAPWV